MIVERLVNISTYTPATPVEPVREFSVMEENAIYYASGYVVRKLLQKHMQCANDKAMAFVGILLNMVGEDTGDSIHDTSTYLDYIKTWTKSVDRGGLRHVTDDTYRCFLAIESIIYKILIKGELKDEILTRVLGDENVRFLWEIAVATELNDMYSAELLQEVVNLWFTIRGFSVVGQLLEQYKKATKSTIKGKKGLRKELH